MVDTTNLVSYYKLDEASGNADDAHSDNDGTVTGATYGADGIINDAYTFNASDANVLVDGVRADMASDTKGTISFWMKPIDATPSSNQTMISFGDTNALQRLSIQNLTNGKCNVILQSDASHDWQLTTNSAVFSDGTWAHVVIVQAQTTSTSKIYINGSAAAASYTDLAGGYDGDEWLSVLSNLDNCHMGVQNMNNDGKILEFKGDIDEVAFFNTNLSSDDISALYNGGAGLAYPFSAAGTNMQINIGDVWREATAVYINVGGVWKEVTGIQQNVGDNWREVF